jgi:hypothetical protein
MICTYGCMYGMHFPGNRIIIRNIVKTINIKKLLTTFRKLFPTYHVSDTTTMRRTLMLGSIAVLLISLVCSVPVAAVNAPCTVSVTSVPDGGTVFIDGIGYGLTPLTGTEVSCDGHTVTVSHEGYADYTAGINFTTGVHKKILANMVGKTDLGSIIIRSEPESAVLYIDGNYRGRTPLTVYNLLPGRHEILLTSDGYEPYNDVVSVSAGMIPEYVEYLIPLPDTGFLSIVSTPDGAAVLIDGNNASVTPTLLRRMTAGNHTVTLYKEGYWNFTGIVNLVAGQSLLVRADLTAIPTAGTLYIDSSPGGLGVYLNQTFKGATPATLDQVPSGDYLLEFRNPEGFAVNRSFSLIPGSTHEIYALFDNGTNGSIIDREWQYQNGSSMTNQPGWISVNQTPVIERTYTWYATDHKASVTLDIPQDLYDYYVNQPHPREVSTEAFSGYAINEKDRQYLHNLVNKLKDASNFRSYSARNDYRNVVAFVQSIEYKSENGEEDTGEVSGQPNDYWKYPIETLADGNGDCEDTSILTAALLKEMGYDVAVVVFSNTDQGHVGTAVACDNCNGYYYPLDGKRYYYLETTGTGFSLGTMDEKYQTAVAQVIPL